MAWWREWPIIYRFEQIAESWMFLSESNVDVCWLIDVNSDSLGDLRQLLWIRGLWLFSHVSAYREGSLHSCNTNYFFPFPNSVIFSGLFRSEQHTMFGTSGLRCLVISTIMLVVVFEPSQGRNRHKLPERRHRYYGTDIPFRFLIFDTISPKKVLHKNWLKRFLLSVYTRVLVFFFLIYCGSSGGDQILA